MASLATIPLTPLFLNKPSSNLKQHSSKFQPLFISYNRRNPYKSNMVLGKIEIPKVPLKMVPSASTVVAATEEKKKKKGFVEEMRAVAMKLHTKEQAREGEKVAKGPEEKSPSIWEPNVDGYLKFLVDSKLVYDTLERIVLEAPVDYYAEFRNTGLERSEKLAKDLEWFKEQGYSIPEPSEPGVTYAKILEELAEKDPQAFICHFYNTYFAHSAGGRMIGRKVAEMILDKKELEFYKWDGDLSELLQNVREKLNKVAEIAASCSYKVQITTGCSSVSYTRDQISLSFGDAHGTQVYVPRIDDPKSGTFEACSTDTFDISGPCIREVCYVYLYRRGHDGWNVGSVKISGQHTRTVTFNFEHWVPSDVWWGFNYCNGASASPIL